MWSNRLTRLMSKHILLEEVSNVIWGFEIKEIILQIQTLTPSSVGVQQVHTKCQTNSQQRN